MAATATKYSGPGGAALTIDVEEWFHSDNVRGVIGREAWSACESRVERNTIRMLEILDEHNVRGTFFVLGWVAERCPGLVRRISAAGHEVASHGYGHDHVYSLLASDFRTDILRSKRLLEDLTGKPVRGYRAPCFSITEWAIPILQDAGFEYDSSVVPTLLHDRYGRLDGMDAGKPITLLREGFYEVCISCIRLGKRGIPWGGGGYFRFVPFGLWLQGVSAILGSGLPYIFYLHPWEIDADQPRVAGISATNRFRQRVNLHQCESRFASLVQAFDWMPLGELIDRFSMRSQCPQTASAQKS
jgi:polysaccharide deacetylase family protein (PEP-CTERM system associated)